MKIAVIGATGQLGSELVKAAERRGHTVEGFRDGRWWAHAGARWYGDVTDPKAMREILETIKPHVVINTAAFHNVDECERNPQRAFEVNALGAENIQKICGDIGALHVSVSTDYVFGGRPPGNPAGYEVWDDPHPLNVYGWSKLYAENAVAFDEYAPGAVARVSYLFGKGGSKQKGGNVIDKILQKLDAGEPLQYHSNVVVSPTYAVDAAEAILNISEPGVYHCSNIGQTSLHGLARAVASLAGLNVDVTPSIYTWSTGGNEKVVAHAPSDWPQDQMEAMRRALESAMTDESRRVLVVPDGVKILPAGQAQARRPEFSAMLPSDGLGITRTWDRALEAYLESIGRLSRRALGGH